jgi:hypothetical protein
MANCLYCGTYFRMYKLIDKKYCTYRCGMNAAQLMRRKQLILLTPEELQLRTKLIRLKRRKNEMD